MLGKIQDFIIKKVFVVSRQPILLKDLLEANLLFNEGMLIDPAKLNFKFNYKNLYLIYALIAAVILWIVIVISHGIFEKADFHFSVLATAAMTSGVFIGFDFFRIWARKKISLIRIKEAWELHFPYFPYEKYSKQVEQIYEQAKKSEIHKKDLESFVLEKIVSSASVS